MGMDVTIERRASKHLYLWGALVLVAVAAVTLGIAKLEDAAPVVNKASVWLGTVQRGALVREVSGPGRLVPEALRVVSAIAPGMVEHIAVEPGESVEADTVLVKLSNRELQLAALEIAGEVKGAEAALLDLKATLAIQQIDQRSTVQKVEMEQREARRQADANETLAKREMVASLTLAETRDRADELSKRLELEREHVAVLESASKARIAAQQAQLDRLRAQRELKEEQVASLEVRAGTAGVVQELPLEVGEQVAIGARLAKVVDPSQLRAELRIPEARAHGIAVGQPARIDIQGSSVTGRVVHVDPAVEGGSVTVDVSLTGDLPAGAKLDLSVDGRIELDRLVDVLHVDKPAGVGGKGHASLFKLAPDGHSAQRVQVELGESSVSSIQVLSGLSEGDRVVLSDMSEWDATDRIEFE